LPRKSNKNQYGIISARYEAKNKQEDAKPGKIFFIDKQTSKEVSHG